MADVAGDTSAASRFRAAVEARDATAAAAVLAPDVVLHSPILHEPFHGRETVGRLLELVPQTIDELHYVDEVRGADGAALVFAGRVGDVEVQGVDLLHEDAAGRIDRFTVMLRPLSAAIAFAKAMGERAAAAGLLSTTATR